MTFYWTIGLINMTGSYYSNSTFNNQTVKNLSLGSCGGGTDTIALNFTLWDEEKLTRVDAWDFKGTFYYYIGNGLTVKNTSVTSSDIKEQTICINQNITFNMDATIEYNANSSGYVTRNYYFDGDEANNVTNNISLYLLNSSDSTSFILKVIDQNQLEVESALIYTQRYYPGTNLYKTVQIAKTDENGKSVGFFKTETVDYRFIIKKDGVTELTTSKQKVIPEETPYTLTFTIGVVLEKPWADFDDLENLDFTLTFNSTTNITTFTYLDSSGNFTQARLLVKKLMYNQTNIVICNSTSSDSSGTLTCDLSAYSGTFIAQVFITRITEKVVSLLNFVITTIAEIMGWAGLLLGWFIILVAGCAFLWHPIAGILGVNFAVIMVSIMGLVSFSALFIFGLIAVSIILIFVLKD